MDAEMAPLSDGDGDEDMEDVGLDRTRMFASSAEPSGGGRHAERRANEHQNWEARRPGLAESLNASAQQRYEVRDLRREVDKAALESVIAGWDPTCTTCGCQSCDFHQHADVLFIGMTWCHKLKLPVYYCRRCVAVCCGK